MEKFSVFFLKWVVLPVAIGAAGFYFVGPKIGGEKPPSKPVALEKIEDPTPAVEATDSADSKPAAKLGDSSGSKTPDEVKASKFDPDVSVSEGDNPPKGSSEGAINASETVKNVANGSVGTPPSVDAPDAPPASVDHVVVKPRPKPRPKPKPKPKPHPKATPVDESGNDPTPPVVHRRASSEEGPGEDVTKLKPRKPKKDKETPPSKLPTTPPDNSEDGGGG